MDELSMVWHVAVAMLLGGIIGIEREIKSKPAGLRTHMLVCSAVTFLTLLSFAAVDIFIETERDVLTIDPIRIIQAIVLGVSFLGAGVIVQDKHGVRNLTTSASILFTAGIGIAVGLDLFIAATALTLLAVLVMYLLGVVENKYLA